MRNPRASAAFTLIEIVLAISIALMVFAVAIPAISSVLEENRLEKTYRDFDAFVRKAQDRALAEHRDFVLVWQKEGISLEPRIPTADDANEDNAGFAANGAVITLQRIAALDPKPPGEWPIWRSGTCEP